MSGTEQPATGGTAPSAAATTGPAPVRPGDDLADALASAVRAVPGVVELHSGTYGEVATYLPGRRVNGIRVRDDGIEVHVVLLYGAPVLETAQAVRAAVQATTPGQVDVTVQDVVDLAHDRTGGRTGGATSFVVEP